MDHKQPENEHLNFSEIFWISNLLSLFRVLIIPLLWHFLAKGDSGSAYAALLILILAGLSDGLDGFIARKLNQISKLGMILDPLCDKILAAALVVLLILYRDFPLWLAAVIIGRDFLILAAALVLLKEEKVVVPSNIAGKYAFFYIVVLLACSVIRFEFGVWLLTYISLALILFSIFAYAEDFGKIKRGESLATFQDKAVYKIIRVGLTAVFLLFLLAKLYFTFE